MSVSFKGSMTVGFILAIPLFALPALAAPTHEAGRKPAQHRVADFAEATAYVSPLAPLAQTLETDGLSRKDDECNFGCVDH